MTTTLALVFGSFTRVDIATSHQSIAFFRAVSDSTSSTLCGSSQMIRSPPSPVTEPPTEVESRYPERLLSKRLLAFWSPVSAKTWPQRAWYQGDSIRRRHFTESR